MNKIMLSMIVKDSEPLDMLARCLYSVAPYVEGLNFTITHKSVKPSQKAKALRRDLSVLCATKGYSEPQISNFQWVHDFSAARNYNFGQIPKDYYWILWLDVDDVLRGGKKLREVADKMSSIEPEIKAVFFNYVYRADFDKDMQIRNILIEHLRERLVRNDGSYKWIAPIHETLIEQRQTNKTDTGLLDVLHISTEERGAKAIGRNIDILERQLKSQGERQDPRTLYYLAKSYFDLHTPEKHDLAEKMIGQYLHGSDTNTPSGWEEERAQAWEYLSEIHRERGHINKAIKATANAMIEHPQFPQFYIDMALNYCFKHDWAKAGHWVKLSQKIAYPKTTLVLNPRDMQARVCEVLFNIGVNTNNLDEAWAAMVKLKEIFPDEKSVDERYQALTRVREDNKVAQNVVMLAKHLEKYGQADKLMFLTKSIPSEIENEQVFVQLRQRIMPPRKWNDDEIALVCGPGFEKWSPKNLDTGIGGSEEAVILVSKELAKLGWKVTVYADPQDDAGEYEGVKYVTHYEFNPNDTFNVLIGWRQVGFFDKKWNAKKSCLWLHDVQNAVEYTKERVDNIDKIFVLSEAHKKTLLNDQNREYLTDDKFVLTKNGVTLPEFKPRKRDSHKVFYGSSYDRGVEHLLAMWKSVKKAVPEATLEVCYGWNLFDKVYHDNPERQAWKAKINKLMQQDGITHHGRVGHPELEEIMSECSIWAYPTHFYEISCITAMRAQMLGTIPVVTNYAALEETVQHGTKVDVSDEDIYESSKKEEYTKALIDMLQAKTKQGIVREDMVRWANENCGWGLVAKQWDEVFKK